MSGDSTSNRPGDNNVKVGVIVPCHNDAQYLDRVLSSIRESEPSSTLVVVADRCTDGSAEVARKYADQVIVKSVAEYTKNSIAENLNLAFELVRDCDYVSKVDSDMVVPTNFFARAVAELDANPQIGSVSSALYTEPSTAFNAVYSGYESLMDLVGMSRRYRRHGHRVYRNSTLMRLFDSRGYVFKDTLAEDSALDDEIGPCEVMRDVKVWHIRKTSIAKSVRGQLRSGAARAELNRSPSSSLKEVARLRPFVFIGYVMRKWGR